MNDDEPEAKLGGALDALKVEHRDLDAQIAALSAEHGPNQLEVARLKKRKLWLKDQIQLFETANIPDIIA